MSSTYSPDLRIELIGTGDQAGVWGATTNNNMAYVLEQAIAGYVSVAVSSANQALTYINGATSVAADNQSVHASLALTTSTGANFAIYAPPASKQYTIYNASLYTATIYNSTVIGNTTAAGTGVAIPAGKTMTVWSDGTNFTQQNTHLNSPSFTTPALGTPASGTLTNATGLPISTGVSGLGSGVATFLATPSSANLAAALTDETGTGANVFANTPTLVTPILGTPTSGTLTNCTGLPVATGISGLGTGVATFLATPSSANLAAAVTGETGSGALVFATSPALTTPDLGTPSAATLTNATGLPIVAGTTGTLSVARGGTGVTTSTGSGNVVLSTSPTLVTPALGTPSSGNLANCLFPTLNQNTTGSAATLTTGRTISLTGDVTGTTGAFDGSAAVSASTTIANSAVTTAKIADANVTAAKLSGAQSGSAPIYGARAWVRFNGASYDGSGNCSINASGNVSSVSRVSAGVYTINFSTAMQDANYAVTVGTSQLDGGGGVPNGWVDKDNPPTSSSVRIIFGNFNSSFDLQYASVVIFR